MAKNIVVIVGSPRRNGNTEILADAFISGAESVGNKVVKITLSELNVNGCVDCKYCFTHDGECCQKDDMQKIYPELYKADMVVFASPVYFFGLTAQIRAVIDRLYTALGKKYPIDSCALLIPFADDDMETVTPSVIHYKAFTSYMKWENKGIVAASGVSDKGDINGHASIEEAIKLGKNIH